jgi:hypothetical protein
MLVYSGTGYLLPTSSSSVSNGRRQSASPLRILAWHIERKPSSPAPPSVLNQQTDGPPYTPSQPNGHAQTQPART